MSRKEYIKLLIKFYLFCAFMNIGAMAVLVLVPLKVGRIPLSGSIFLVAGLVVFNYYITYSLPKNKKALEFFFD